MAGQAVLSIRDKQWNVSLANAPWELAQGLGGLPSISPWSGMLFDLGYEQAITVTTEPMLFALDIAFLSEELVVTELYRDVQPGYLVNSTKAARYFLEVNAAELKDINTNDQTSFEMLSLYMVATVPDWLPAITSFMGFALMGVFMAGMVKDLTRAMFNSSRQELLLSENKVVKDNISNKRCAFCRSSEHQCEVCERISPKDYHLLSWVGAPVPDYSFAIEAETKERRIDEVLKTLKEGVDAIQNSDRFRQFLLTMSKFHDYSIGNLILIMLQKPDATHVAGFSTWKDLGRWVKKGEKGIAILAPCMPPKAVKTEPTKKPELKDEEKAEETESEEVRPLFFKVVYVFNVSQTEGKPLPEFEVPVLTGEANEKLFNLAVSLAKSQGLDLSLELRPEQDPDIKGMYSGKSIWVKSDESRAQQLKTLLHETAHYYSEGVFHIPRRDAETIAESVAFTVGAHFGFDTGTRSFPYVALWSKDKKVLEQNLAAIRKVSAKIIDALEQIPNNAVGMPLLDSSQGLPVARLLDKWQTAKVRNSALAMKDLEALGPNYDTEDCKQAIIDYKDIEPGDYSDREEYQEARDEAWEAFIECLESLAGEEEEMNLPVSQTGDR